MTAIEGNKVAPVSLQQGPANPQIFINITAIPRRVVILPGLILLYRSGPARKIMTSFFITKRQHNSIYILFKNNIMKQINNCGNYQFLGKFINSRKMWLNDYLDVVFYSENMLISTIRKYYPG